MINDNGSINLQFVKEQANILKIQVQSRHISRKLYRCFIGYRPNSKVLQELKDMLANMSIVEEQFVAVLI